MAMDIIARRALQQRGTRIAFFVAGFATAAWAPLVPFAKARAGLDDGGLGLLLLCLGIGSIIAMPLSGVAASRFGCRPVLVSCSVVVAMMLPLLAWLSAPLALGLALFVFGAAIGSIDCVINVQSIIVERESGRRMMSNFHGLFSVGGIAGSAGVGTLLLAGLPLVAASGTAAAIVLAATAFAASGYLRRSAPADGPLLAWPRGIVLVIGMLCFIVFLTEGAMLDWSAVFLTQIRGLDPAWAGFGYAAFATTMTIGRLTGDRIVHALGPVRIAVFGSLLAASGLALATFVPHAAAGLAGFALVGAGCSNIVPVLYSAVGRQRTMPEHIAVPAISTLGYAGILAGPAAIGAVAKATTLPIALLCIAALLLVVTASARMLRR